MVVVVAAVCACVISSCWCCCNCCCCVCVCDQLLLQIVHVWMDVKDGRMDYTRARFKFIDAPPESGGPKNTTAAILHQNVI